MITAVLIGAVALFGPSCSEDGGGDEPLTGSAERRMLLSSLAQRVILPTLRDFADAAASLRDATDAYAQATDDVATPLADAQTALHDAMLVWQRAEVMQVGPAGAPDMVMGGLGLRDEIYSYPTVASCRVDQALVDEAYAEPDFFDATVVNAYGLDALSYLLAYAEPDNTCTDRAAINTDGSWAAISEADLQQRRADYAARIATEVARQAAVLRDAWEPDEGNFAAEFLGDGEVYDSPHEALDAVYAALFYADLTIKNQKLALPAGISPDCVQATCPELVEDPWSMASGAYVAANLQALRDIVYGGPPDDPDAYGFDDLLRALDGNDVADSLTAAVDAAVDATDALPEDLAVAVADEHDTVVEAHTRVRELTDLLKSQLVTVLGLRVPNQGAGDND